MDNVIIAHLIPWPGPQVIPEMLTMEDPALIAMQSSPVKITRTNSESMHSTYICM